MVAEQTGREAEATKRAYRKPELREYGDVRELTEDIVGGSGKHDGAFYGMQQLKTGG